MGKLGREEKKKKKKKKKKKREKQKQESEVLRPVLRVPSWIERLPIQTVP
jgi:hypothetical protein